MKADAPGKLVISGAYSVLRGAPALVTAVDLRVFADTTRQADFLAPEVTEGLKLLPNSGSALPPPWYDAAALRGETQKLGLGSSAAICVASLGALLAQYRASNQTALDLTALRSDLYPLARLAHQRAQGGGSGIDIAAACFGGTLVAELPGSPGENDLPLVRPVALPPSLTFEVWGHPKSASTSDFVKAVFALETRDSSNFQNLMAKQAEASRKAARATQENSPGELVFSLKAQLAALSALGLAASVPIVLPEILSLNSLLTADACLLPSGAGGGDVNLYVGPLPTSLAFRARASQMGLEPVPLSLGAPGLQIQSGSPPT